MTSAVLGATVTDDGGSRVTDRGFFWADHNFEAGDENVNRVLSNEGKGEFSKEICGLEPGTEYWFRAYAVNSEGMACTEAACFRTAEEAGVSVASSALDIEWYDTDEGLYLCSLTVFLNLTNVSAIETAGITVNGEYHAVAELPSYDGGVSLNCPLRTDGSAPVDIYPEITTKSGRRIVGNSDSVTSELFGIKGGAFLNALAVDYYSEPERNFYRHWFSASVTLTSGASRLNQLGFFLNDGGDMVFDLSGFRDGAKYSATIYTDSKYSDLQESIMGKAWYSTDGYICFTGNDTYSSYDDSSDKREYFFTEYFDDGNGKFSTLDVSVSAELGTCWMWNSDYQEMKGSSYKNGVNYDCESWLYSDEIDLTSRRNATLTFLSVTRYFHDISAQARLMITSDGGDSWTELEIPALENASDNSWTEKSVSLNAWIGKTVQIAFAYKGMTEGAGMWWIDSVEIYESK